MISFSGIRRFGTLVLMCSLAVGASAQSADETEKYSELGQQALSQGNYPEAQAAFEKLRELQPGVAEVHANLGAIYFQERKFEPAVSALRQALKLKPALPKSAAMLAMSLSELGRYDEAVPGLEKGFRQSTDPLVKRMCGLQLLRAYTGLRRDSKAVEVALELNRALSQRSGSALSHWKNLRKLRVPEHAAAGAGGANVGLEASSRGRGLRKPGIE